MSTFYDLFSTAARVPKSIGLIFQNRSFSFSSFPGPISKYIQHKLGREHLFGLWVQNYMINFKSWVVVGNKPACQQLLLTGFSLKMKMYYNKSTSILDLALMSVKASFASALLLPPFTLSCLALQFNAVSSCASWSWKMWSLTTHAYNAAESLG